MKKSDVRQTIFSGILFVFGVFCLALCYNLFFSPNSIVVGGMSGLAIIINKYTGLNRQVFIYASSFILLIVSYIFLGKEKTRNTAIGSVLYPIFVTFTSPIATLLLKYITFDEVLIMIFVAGIMHGASNGIIYRLGFTTGGSDVIMKLLCKYFHLTEGQSSKLMNGTIIILGALTFGFEKGAYALIVLVISSYMTDRVMMGISDSKKFMIYTRESKKVKDVIQDEFKAGYTIFPTVGGYSHIHGAMIMCVIRNRDVNYFKDRILEVDPEIFFVISDCYQVQGGIKRSNLPFI